jgi:hypothetical protein
MLSIKDLIESERVALTALAKLIVGADRDFSRGEAKMLRRIVDAMGENQFLKATEAAQKKLRGMKDPRAFALEVERDGAQELIYNLLYDLAVPDDIVEAEKQILRWLAKVWNITVDETTLAPKA